MEDDVKSDALPDAPDEDESVGTDGGNSSSDISASPSPRRSACLAAKLALSILSRQFGTDSEVDAKLTLLKSITSRLRIRIVLDFSARMSGSLQLNLSLIHWLLCLLGVSPICLKIAKPLSANGS